jgi:hypothetical protein
METKHMHIIKLAAARDGQPKGSLKRMQNADVVIDATGMVIKDRFGAAHRPATNEELRLAVAG